MPVDLYIGGQEHAVLHLLYSRFWHHVLYDLGLVSTKEPFKKLYNQGMILGDDGTKMSKSRGNVINPEEIMDEYGADSMRLYEMFMGPLNKSKPWSTKGLQGCYRFINKLWSIISDDEGFLSSKISNDVEPDKETLFLHHQTRHSPKRRGMNHDEDILKGAWNESRGGPESLQRVCPPPVRCQRPFKIPYSVV